MEHLSALLVAKLPTCHVVQLLQVRRRPLGLWLQQALNLKIMRSSLTLTVFDRCTRFGVWMCREVELCNNHKIKLQQRFTKAKRAGYIESSAEGLSNIHSYIIRATSSRAAPFWNQILSRFWNGDKQQSQNPDTEQGSSIVSANHWLGVRSNACPGILNTAN